MVNHGIYLALIVVLVLVAVCAIGLAVKTRRQLLDIEDAFGLREDFLAGRPRPAPLRNASESELLREKTYDELKREVDALVARALKLGEFRADTSGFGAAAPDKAADFDGVGRGGHTALEKACAYALRGGKRVRPIVLIEMARAAGARARRKLPPVDVGESALAIEYLHTASLVIDDLPAFDDDRVRRGAESVHAKFGEATAHMAAAALVSGGFQSFCRQVDWIRSNLSDFRTAERAAVRVCGEASRALGVTGAAGGQYIDTVTDLARLYSEFRGGAPTDKTAGSGGASAVVAAGSGMKTASFFELACVAGWLFGGGGGNALDDIRKIGRSLGAAFQIADDISDVDEDAERRRLGKQGWNYVLVFGMDIAYGELQRNLNACRLLLTRHGLFSPLWREIIDKVYAKTGDPPQVYPTVSGTESVPNTSKLSRRTRDPAVVPRNGQSSERPNTFERAERADIFDGVESADDVRLT